MDFKLFSSIFGLYPLDTSALWHHSCDSQKMSPSLAKRWVEGRRGKITLMKTTAMCIALCEYTIV